MIQLSNVAGPSVRHKNFICAFRKFFILRFRSTPGIGVDLPQEILDEDRQITLSFTKGWQSQDSNCQTMKQVFSESSSGNIRCKVSVRGRNDSHADFDRRGSSEWRDFAGLQGPQKPYLGVKRQVTHFVEEKGAATGFLEMAFAVRHGPREGPPSMAKELRTGEFWSYRAAIDGDDGRTRSSACSVDRLSKKLLSSARLTQDQYRHIEYSNSACQIDLLSNDGAAVDDLGELWRRLLGPFGKSGYALPTSLQELRQEVAGEIKEKVNGLQPAFT